MKMKHQYFSIYLYNYSIWFNFIVLLAFCGEKQYLLPNVLYGKASWKII